VPDEYDFDVAVSFAGEDRTLVAEIVDKLKDQQVSVFYDQDFVSDMWGENLADYLHEVYRRRARFALIFISRHYGTQMWTRHERQSAQDRALNQPTPYLLPLRLDDTELPGLASTVGYLDAREKTVDEIVAALLRKVGASRQEAEPRFNGKVPRTQEELATLLAERPRGWEWILHAGVLRQEIHAREDKYRDHLLGYSPRSGKFITDDEAPAALKRNISNFEWLLESSSRVMDPRAQDAAVGAPGEPGDPERIVHLARRMASAYEDFIDLAAELRATNASSEAVRRVLEVQARWADQPLEAFRSFVDDLVREMDTLHDRLLRGERIEIVQTITLEIGDELVRQHREALEDFYREQQNE
jgi:hypothetical protein